MKFGLKRLIDPLNVPHGGVEALVAQEALNDMNAKALPEKVDAPAVPEASPISGGGTTGNRRPRPSRRDRRLSSSLVRRGVGTVANRVFSLVEAGRTVIGAGRLLFGGPVAEAKRRAVYDDLCLVEAASLPVDASGGGHKIEGRLTGGGEVLLPTLFPRHAGGGKYNAETIGSAPERYVPIFGKPG